MPHNNNNVLAQIAPATDDLPACCGGATSASAMTSSVQGPSVALRRHEW